MISILTLLLQIAGAGLLLLAILHFPISKQLQWREDVRQLTPMNATVFHVHTFFVCVVLVMMALPCLLEPSIFLVKSAAGRWLTWSVAGFWALRLYCQWFVYQPELWRGKWLETMIHYCFTMVWTALTAVFTACGLSQVGWWTTG